jgi:hypothetical protein
MDLVAVAFGSSGERAGAGRICLNISDIAACHESALTTLILKMTLLKRRGWLNMAYRAMANARIIVNPSAA